MILYHGSVSGLTEILPPLDTGNLREEGRQVRLDLVFATPNRAMAESYARTTAKKVGGVPVVYEVTGTFRPWKNRPRPSIWVAPSAMVVGSTELS